MKKITLAFVAFLISLGSIRGQDMQAAKAQAKIFARDFRAELAPLINSEQLSQAEANIGTAIRECESMADPITCAVGIYFTAGWLYHEAAKSPKISNPSEYWNYAIKYYENVLALKPDNQSAQSNLMQVRQLSGSSQDNIAMLQALIERDPQKRTEYWIQIGNIYQSQGELTDACAAYQKAYTADIYSAAACAALVRLHTSGAFSCIMGENVVYFAYDCQSVGLPNYAVDIFNHEIAKAINSGNTRDIERAIICWADIMAENGWLTSRRVQELAHTFFQEDHQSKGWVILTELQDILAEDLGETSRRSSFWQHKHPRITISKQRQHSTPLVVRFKILHQRANEAYFGKDLEGAEKIWRAAIEEAGGDHNIMFTRMAKNLAQLYLDHPELDPLNTKFDRLVRKLYAMKGSAYSTTDKALIREYHITLGTIFYQEEKWRGDGGRNARHQLSRALSDQLGVIVHPQLRTMLAEVYRKLDKSELAVDTELKAVQDFLALDDFGQAAGTLDNTRRFVKQMGQDRYLPLLAELEMMLQLRQDAFDPDHPLLISDLGVYSYLSEMAQIERQNFKKLPSSFIQVQFFKTYSDLAGRLGNDRSIQQQILYAEALQKIRNIRTLPSMSDLDRIQKIKNSLEQSFENTNRLPSMQVKQQADLNYADQYSREDVKTYLIPNLNREIEIPLNLFKLRDLIQQHYDGDEKMGMPLIEWTEKREMKVKG